MKFSMVPIAAGLAVLLCLSVRIASAQETAAGPTGARVALATSDQEKPAEDAYGVTKACDAKDGSCGQCSSCGESFLHPNCSTVADLGDPFRLADRCFFQENNIQTGGWLAQSFTWNPDSPQDKYNGPVTWTDRANEYQLNELYFFLGKAADTEGCGWDYGYRVDALYGTSYRWCTAVGMESFWNSYSEYGLAMPQVYGEIACNNLTVKAGRFLSPVGYYAVGTNNNFFPFLPYTFQYGEPFTHTGINFTYKFSDEFTWANGVVRGWDNFDPNNVPPGFNRWNPNLSWLSNAILTRENGDTLAWVGLLGQDFSLSPTSDGWTTRYFQTLVYQRKFSDDVLGVLQSDFGTQENATPTGETARWYGVNSYLYWNQTCRLQWGTNFEWFRDNNGFRVGPAVPSAASPDARGWTNGGTYLPGFAGNFWSFAIGPKYFFTPNIYGRAAYRFDWYDGEKPLGANGPLSPYNDGEKDSQHLVVFDMVMTF